jgi:Domain of unknown function (DUF4180)
MDFKLHEINSQSIAEILDEEQLIQTIEDGFDLVGTFYFEGVDRVLLKETHLNPDFFDLKTGFAGEILQKFSTYGIKLTIIGHFDRYKSESLNAFIFESNRIGKVQFKNNLDEAIENL